jgi:hypothetical protein
MVFLQTEKAIRKASATVRSGVTAVDELRGRTKAESELKAREKRVYRAKPGKRAPAAAKSSRIPLEPDGDANVSA